MTQNINVDTVEAGSGPPVILVHSAASGAHQWRSLMNDLKGRFHLIAVNLFGYGKTPRWRGSGTQSLEDQARLVETVAHKCNGEIGCEQACKKDPVIGVIGAQ